MRYCCLFFTFLLFNLLQVLPLPAQQIQEGKLKIVSEYSSSSFPLVHEGDAATLYIDAGSAEVVKIVAEAFSNDVELITAKRPVIKQDLEGMAAYPVIIGTIGQSKLIDQLFENEISGIAAIKGEWEAFSISVIDNPFEGVEKALVVAGSDSRGTAYGVFELSQLIGVSPWNWWADVAPRKQQNLYVSAGSKVSGAPSVKYRGIFLNDEDWGLQPWAAQNIDADIKDIGPKTYARIFELLLRLKANLIWPAMHPSTKAFFHYPGNPKVAEDYSIVIGTSHAEPMLRNNVDEWDKESMGAFDYRKNKESVYNYWDKRAAESSSNEAVYTVGMRGIHDSGMEGVKSTTEAAEILEQIIADQRKILSEHIEKDAASIPQAFTAYKEVLDIYDHGLELPQDITLVWPDDNYGYIRRLSNKEEQERSGGAGVYYHASYWGRPHDYLWLSSTHPSLIWEEMWKAYQLNARDIWVLNVGDIKPLEYNIELFMDMAYNMNDFESSKDVKKHMVRWVQEIFGEELSAEITEVLSEYYGLAFQRRPEFMGWSRTEPTTQTNLTAYNHFYYGDEAQQRIDRYNALEKQVKDIRSRVSSKDRDAFYQLVYYPVVGSSLMNKKFLYRDKSHLYALQQRSSAADYALMAQQAYDSIVQETNYYNNELADGKWKGMMSMEPRELPVYQAPVLPEIQKDNANELGVMPEGYVLEDSSFIVDEKGGFMLPDFHPWKDQKYFIDLYLKGDESLQWKASASDDWVVLSEEKGLLRDEKGHKQRRVWVSVDWSKVSKKKGEEAFVSIKGPGKKVKIAVRTFNSSDPELRNFDGFIAENGYISIAAENFSRKTEKEEASWEEIEGLGYTGASLMALPLKRKALAGREDIIENAPSVEYDFYVFSDTSAEINIHTLPTHPVTDKHSMRFAVSVDGGELQIVDFRTHGRSEEWKMNVLRNSAVSQLKDQTLSKGKHRIKIYMIDPGVILDRITIDAGGLQKGYSTIPETKKVFSNSSKGL